MTDNDEEIAAGLSRQLTAVEGSIKEIPTFTNLIIGNNMPSSTELEARHELLNEILRQATSILLRLESVKGTS